MLKKEISWARFVDGKSLPIHWFEGSVNGESNIKMHEDKVWPSVKQSAFGKRYKSALEPIQPMSYSLTRRTSSRAELSAKRPTFFGP